MSHTKAGCTLVRWFSIMSQTRGGCTQKRANAIISIFYCMVSYFNSYHCFTDIFAEAEFMLC